MEQQQQRIIHQRVLEGIERLSDPSRHEKKDLLWINGYDEHAEDGGIIDRPSLQYLVDFLGSDDRSHEVTELKLLSVHLDPSDGGLNVLRDFFSRSYTTLTKVTLSHCNFGTAEDTVQLLTGFQTNRTVSDLTFHTIRNLEGAALGACLSSLVHNMPQLQRLACYYSNLRAEEVRAFPPGLHNNQTLKELYLTWCYLEDEGIRLIADSMVGNTTMQVLDISCNFITSNGVDDITRLIESTQLKTLLFSGDNIVYDNRDANQQHFLTMLGKNTTIQELQMPCHVQEIENVVNIVCARNKSLTQVHLLLAPLTLQRQHQPSNGMITTTTTNTTTTATTTMWIKTCHKAIVQFAMLPDNAGASAIFKLFQTRPALLEKRLKRPTIATASVSQEQQKRRRV